MRFRGAVQRHGDCLGELAIGAIEAPVAELRTGLESNEAEAVWVVTAADELLAKVKEIAADGKVDASEKRWLDRTCPNLARLTEAHRQNAGALIA
jgi:hypothetical protein